MIARFAKDERGVGAVEFALVVPVILLIYLMGSQIGIALSVDRKVSHATGVVADILTQATDLTAQDMDGVLTLASPLLSPYPTEPFGMVVTAVWLDDKGRATVECSRSNRPDVKARRKNSAFTLPPSLASLTNRTVLVSETTYEHQPAVGGYGIETFELGETLYHNPRSGGRFTWKGC